MQWIKNDGKTLQQNESLALLFEAAPALCMIANATPFCLMWGTPAVHDESCTKWIEGDGKISTCMRVTLQSQSCGLVEGMENDQWQSPSCKLLEASWSVQSLIGTSL